MDPAVPATSSKPRRWWTLSGLGLAGYGLLILLKVLPHDAQLAGFASLTLGIACLAIALRGGTSEPAARSTVRARIVAGIGAVAVVGVLGYNGLRGSGFQGPEWGILVYGVALIVASGHLHRRLGQIPVGTLVAWSFPILLAPLAMYALNAVLSADNAGTAATPVVNALVVKPTGAILWIFGISATVVGNSLILDNASGRLILGVGLVCAGLYPMVLFGGLMGLHAWENRIPAKRLAAYVGIGLGGLWVTNLIRIVILVQVGKTWGGAAVQGVHAHIGWVLFGIFMLAYWAIVLRVVEPRRPMDPTTA